MTRFTSTKNESSVGLARRITSIALAAGLVAVVLSVAGCASTESDLPWATPASWEGSPQIPGMPTQ